jgi:hypothetical protein
MGALNLLEQDFTVIWSFLHLMVDFELSENVYMYKYDTRSLGDTYYAVWIKE